MPSPYLCFFFPRSDTWRRVKTEPKHLLAMASGFIGKIDPFDNSKESWPSYIERAEQFFLVNDIASEKKAPILLTTMGSKTYSLLRSLVSPAKTAEKSYSDIVKILQANLNPAPLKIAERFRFLQRMQEEGETIGQYIACLQKMTEYCDYGTILNQILRDKLIPGSQKYSAEASGRG